MAINLSAFAGAGAQFFDDNGDPLAGGFLYTFAAGTTTPIVTYTTQLGDVNNTNPIVLDAGGRTPYEIWVNGGVLYKFRLTDSAGVLIGDYDNIPAIDDPTVFNNLITVTGTNTLIGTSVPPITGYVAGATYSFIPINSNTGAVTIDIDGFGSKEILFNSSATLSPGALQAGKIAVIEYDGTRFQLVNSVDITQIASDTRIDVTCAATINLTSSAPSNRNIRITGSTGPITGFTIGTGLLYYVSFSGTPTITNNSAIVTNTGTDIEVTAGDSCIIRSTAANTVEILDYVRYGQAVNRDLQSISASVGSSALTISASALALDFRSATVTSGTVTRVTGTPANLVISSGSTLGTTSGVQSNVAVLAINNAGTIELAAINLDGGVELNETGVISTTAEGGAGAADSATTIYSTTARTNVAYRVLGIVRSTQATAGTWATTPSLIQGIGGESQAGKKLYPVGIAPVYGVRAWAMFNGTTVGTNAPTAGGNITSITRNAAGDYTATFTVAAPHANYDVKVLAGYQGQTLGIPLTSTDTAPSTTAYRFRTVDTASTPQDSNRVMVSFIW